jgi:predicted peptidase
MKNLLQLMTCTALVTLTAGMAAEPAANPNPPTLQMAKKLTFKKSQKFKVDYLLFLPKDYDTRSKKRWPLILFLHGAGERGTNVWKVAAHGPPKRVAQHPEFPFIVVSPQCPEGQIWSSDALLGLLDETLKNYKVDTSRVYLTGLSMGGYATWDLGLSHPERFAAIVPICGGAELITVLLASGKQAEALKTLGVWAFHGAKDPVVPLEESQRMVPLLKKFGVQDVNLTVYPDAGHDAWTETYNNPELYDWLLKHQR